MTLEAQIYTLTKTTHTHFKGTLSFGVVSSLTTDSQNNVIPNTSEIDVWLRLETDVTEAKVSTDLTILAQTAYIVKASIDLEALTIDKKILFKSDHFSANLYPKISAYQGLVSQRGIEVYLERINV